MSTIKLYQSDVYRKTAEAVVVSAERSGDTTRVVLDQTIFFPEGGGQSCDKGTICKGSASFPVTDVHEKNDVILHTVECSEEDLSPGDTVLLSIDWERRFDNMQRHCGEHILTGAFVRLYGAANKGFHMGEDFITIDIAFDPDSSFDRVTWEMAETAEAEANRVIAENYPVRVDLFDTREEAEKCKLRKALAFDEAISIVTIGDPEAPMDCVACCGTHPAQTGQVGLVKIYKIEPNKGMSRIYFECGRRAFRKYQEQFNVLYDLGVRLSAGYEDVLKKFDAQEKRNQETRDQLQTLRSILLHQEAAQLKEAMHPGLVASYEEFTVDDLFNLGKLLAGSITGAVALVHKPSNTAILLSEGDPHCGKLVKENAFALGGKGGGNATSARAFFSDAESLEQFLSTVLGKD